MVEIIRETPYSSSSGALNSRSIWGLCGVRQNRFSIAQVGKFVQALGQPLGDIFHAILTTRSPRMSFPVHAVVAVFFCVFATVIQTSSTFGAYHPDQVPYLFISVISIY
jgi:hypothetical protein